MLEQVEDVLGRGRLVSSYKDEWEFKCPQCAQPDHLHVSFLKNVYICVTPRCGNKGKLTELITGLELKPSRTKPVNLNKELMVRIYSKLAELGTLRKLHKEWLLSRGINADKPGIHLVSSDDLFDALMERFETSEMLEAGLAITKFETVYPATVLTSGRIIILYNDPYTLDYHYARSRAIGTNSIKYASPAGVPGNHVSWGWQNIRGNTWIVVTEGEFKAQAAHQAGVPCIALPGINVGHTAFVQACVYYGIKNVCILFDTEVDYCDGIPKQLMIDRLSLSLASQLQKAGISAFRAVLPVINKSKTDIDSFLLHHGTAAGGRQRLLDVLKNSKRFDDVND